MVFDIISTYSVNEANMYLIDFGSEALKIFREAPQIGDVVLSTDSEKISRLFEMLQKEMKKRTELTSNYGGDIKLFINDINRTCIEKGGLQNLCIQKNNIF